MVRWTKISRNLELFEEEIRETVHMVYQLSKCFGKKPVMPAEQLLSIKHRSECAGRRAGSLGSRCEAVCLFRQGSGLLSVGRLSGIFAGVGR